MSWQLFRRYDTAMADQVVSFTWDSYGSTVYHGMNVIITAQENGGIARAFDVEFHRDLARSLLRGSGSRVIHKMK